MPLRYVWVNEALKPMKAFCAFDHISLVEGYVRELSNGSALPRRMLPRAPRTRLRGGLACTRFRRHQVTVFNGTGERSWRDDGSRESSRSGVVCSMSRSGNVWDNAAMESFFSSLKTERTGQKTYRSRDEAKADVFDYIERFYNAKRRHSTIGYLSPMEFERRAGFA